MRARRQGIAVLALIGGFVSIYLLLYKLGVFGTLICGDGGCMTVQNSPWAYFLGVPVAAWGVIGYVAIFATAIMGTQPRFETRPWVPRVLLALTGFAFLFTLYLAYLEEFVIHAWCQWCIGSGVISVLAFLVALPEIGAIRRNG